jgi:hypothetical protein
LNLLLLLLRRHGRARNENDVERAHCTRCLLANFPELLLDSLIQTYLFTSTYVSVCAHTAQTQQDLRVFATNRTERVSTLGAARANSCPVESSSVQRSVYAFYFYSG